jgi:hypothetical protein
MNRCISGKRAYPTQQVAEDVLIEAWIRYDYNSNNGPMSVYKCDECGNYHLTSRGPMNERLANALGEGKIQQQKEARRWEERFKGR